MTNDKYEVGYKKPPKSTQFKKGQSGNISGRKKGKRNIKSDLVDELSEIMVVQENGSAIEISKQRIFLKQLCNHAIKGDHKSGQLLATFMHKYLVETDDSESKSEVISVDDEDILKHYVQTYKSEE